MIKKILIFAALTLAGCTDEQEAIVAAEALGLTEVQITGYEFFGCGRDDSFSTGFVARSVSGKRVTGVVCSGIMKGATVRITGDAQ